MAKQVETDSAAKAQFWDRLGKSRVSMLWIEGSGQHPQPMTHYPDADNGVIWFITSSETDLYRAIGSGSAAGLTFQAQSGDYQASAEGRLEAVRDEAKLDELWSVPAAAWFADGRGDERIRLLRFEPHEAAIWASEASRVLVGLKLLRAGTTEGRDAVGEVGVHRVVGFERAA